MLNSIRVKGHYYAAPVNIHSTSWFWFPMPALKKAGVAEVPTTFDDLFVALDKLKAAGLILLAHGGQTWQDAMMFTTTLSNVGGKELYLKVLRDRDPKTILGEDLKKALGLQAPAVPHRPRRPGPQLERRHRVADRRQGRRAGHGRLGQGRVPAGQGQVPGGLRPPRRHHRQRRLRRAG